MPLISRLTTALALALPLSALADPADFDLPGPNGRSAVALTADAYRSSYDSISPTATASVEGSNRAITLQGTLAIGERVSIDAGTSRSVYHATVQFNGTTLRDKDASNDHSLGIYVRAVGSPTANGFGLVLGWDVGHTEGGDSGRSLLVMPQYRFNDRLALSVTAATGRSPSVRYNSLQAMLTIKAAPSLSVTPMVGYGRSEARDVPSPSSRTSWLGATVAYHVNNNLSLIGGLRVLASADTDFGGGYTITDHVAYNSTLGLRWQF